MKRIALLMLLPLLAVGQKQRVGSVYSEHPAYDVVKESYRVWESGTEEELRALYAEDAKIWGPGDKEAGDVDGEVQGMLWWQKNFDVTFLEMNPARHFTTQYRSNKGAYVFDWMMFRGIHKESGDTVEGPLHSTYFVNDDGKIAMSISYFDRETIGAQIQESFGWHRNGRVYDEHPLIDKLNTMVNHFEEGELDELQDYFTEDAAFYRLGDEKKYSLEERRGQWDRFVSATTNRKLEQSGYPDAIYYSRGEGAWVVYSWWWENFTNAATGEVSREYLHMTHTFNEDGKCVREIIYTAN